MANLLGSRWAPPKSGGSPTAVTRLHEMRKCDRLFRRLKWKSSLLLVSHQRATDGQVDALAKYEAQTMFKVDFFEFYLLIERLLIHLLEFFRVPVKNYTSVIASRTGGLDGAEVNDSGSSATPRYHRFHAEVLEAMSRPSNPLHPLLGVDPVKSYLQAAKGFRNKWKDAAEESYSSAERDEESDLSRRQLQRDRLVDDLDLEDMLRCITEALNSVRDLAEKDLQNESVSSSTNEVHSGTNGSSTWASYDMMDCDDEDVPWEAIPDAMDWENI